MTPESQLAKFARDQDQMAFAAVVTHFTPLVYGLALRRSNRTELALEIAQDVFLACARKAPALVRARTMLGPWLHRTTLLETMNHMRKEASHLRRADAVRQLADTSPDTPDDAAWTAALPHLDEVMDKLSETDRTAVMLRFYSGRSFPEIGNQMGRTEEAARKLCARALEKLSALLRRRGVLLPVAALTAGLSGHWSSAQAAVPAGMTGTILAHVGRNLALPAAVPALTIFTIMKSTTFITAAVLVLLTVPAAIQWREMEKLKIELPGSVPVSVASTDARASRLSAAAKPKSARPELMPEAEEPSEDAIRIATDRLLELKMGDSDGNHDIATVLEMNTLTETMKGWPASALRRSLDQLLAGNEGGRLRLELAADIMESAYAGPAPADATKLALSQLDRDPLFTSVATLSAGEWFAADPAGARAWIAAEEGAGRLESTGILDKKRAALAQAEILGSMLIDPIAAREQVAAADPVTAASAVNLLLRRRRDLPPEQFTGLALSIRDPARAGDALGSYIRTGMDYSGSPERTAAEIQSRIPASLPAEVRVATIVEASQVGGFPECFAVLARTAAPADLEAGLARMAAQFHASGNLPADGGWQQNEDVTPYLDKIAAAAALALGSPEFPAAGKDAATAARWLQRIQDATLRAQTAARMAAQ